MVVVAVGGCDDQGVIGGDDEDYDDCDHHNFGDMILYNLMVTSLYLHLTQFVLGHFYEEIYKEAK